MDDDKEATQEAKILSDSSDENLVDGITTPHGPASLGRTHPGGNFKGTCTQESASPPATRHQSTGHRHSPTRQEDITGQPAITGQPVTGQPVITQINTSVNHWSPVTGHWTYKFRLQAEVNIHRSTGHRSSVCISAFSW